MTWIPCILIPLAFLTWFAWPRSKKKSPPKVVETFMADWQWGVGMWVKNGTDQEIVIARAYLIAGIKESRWRYYDTYALQPPARSRKVLAGVMFPVYFMMDVEALVSYDIEWFTTVVELVDGRKIVARGRRIVRSPDGQFWKIMPEVIEL